MFLNNSITQSLTVNTAAMVFILAEKEYSRLYMYILRKLGNRYFFNFLVTSSIFMTIYGYKFIHTSDTIVNKHKQALEIPNCAIPKYA
jgi:amino acid transporter